MSQSNPPTPPSDAEYKHHERGQIPLRGFVIFVIGFITIAVVLHFILWALFGVFSVHKEVGQASPLVVQQVIPPDPQIQGVTPHPATPRQDMAEFLQQENQVLSTYGWVDQGRGVARIPVQRAMQMLVERGLPSTQPASTQPQVSGQ